MSDYISREAMSEKPKCPGCGADMELMHLCNAAFCYVCTKCGWDSPTGIDSESAFRMAMRRAEPVQHGYWIIPTPPDVYTYCKIVCSVCNQVAGKHQTEYCPRCGAKMDLPRPRSNSDE